MTVEEFKSLISDIDTFTNGISEKIGVTPREIAIINTIKKIILKYLSNL